MDRDACQFCSYMWHNDNLEAYFCQTSKGRSYEEAKLLGGRTHLSFSGTKCSVSVSEEIPAYPQHTALEAKS